MISANTTFRDREYLVWKVDAYRLLAGEYSLTARSRVPNVWAFILTGVLILLGIGFWIKSDEQERSEIMSELTTDYAVLHRLFMWSSMI